MYQSVDTSILLSVYLCDQVCVGVGVCVCVCMCAHVRAQDRLWT